MSVNLSMVIHAIQAVLSPVSVWATIKEGLIAGIMVLAFIGFLEFIDILLSARKSKAKNRA